MPGAPTRFGTRGFILDLLIPAAAIPRTDMNQDIFFLVSTASDGAYVARALGHPVEARAASASELKGQAQRALADYLGPSGWGRRITLLRTRATSLVA